MKKPVTYAIIYGIGEGPLIGHRMRQILTAKGYAEVEPTEAEIVLTHSGGAYMLPATARAKLYVHFNCTQYMPLRELLAAHRSKIRYDFNKRRANKQLLRWLLALGANGWYFLHISRGLRMRLGFNRSEQLLGSLPTGQHVFICGKADRLSDSEILMRHTSQRHTYVSIEGGHDDCWRQPEPYVSAIRSLFAAS